MLLNTTECFNLVWRERRKMVRSERVWITFAAVLELFSSFPDLYVAGVQVGYVNGRGVYVVVTSTEELHHNLTERKQHGERVEWEARTVQGGSGEQSMEPSAVETWPHRLAASAPPQSVTG